METDKLSGEIDTKSKHCYTFCEFRSWISKNLLLIMTFFGIILGFILGFSIRLLEPSQTALLWLGKVFCFLFITALYNYHGLVLYTCVFYHWY